MAFSSDSKCFEVDVIAPVAELTQAIVLVVNASQQVIYMNSFSKSIFGISEDTRLPINLFETFSLVDMRCPVGSSYFLDKKKLVKKIDSVQWKVSLIDESENIIITGHDEAHQSMGISGSGFEQIIDHTPGSIYWKDTDGRYLGCNRFMVKTAGLNSRDEIIGKTDYELWPGNAKKIRDNDLSVIDSGEPLWLEEKVDLENKAPMYFASSKIPLRDEANRIIGIIANSIDITKLKNTEHDLLIEKRKVEESNRVKQDFLENMEHDIRTPLNGILGVANLLLDQENCDEEKREMFSDILICSKELLGYFDRILDFSRLENGLVPVVDEPFSIRKMTESLINIHKVAVNQKALKLNANIEPKVPEILLGDPYRIQRILLNLIGNAVKFTSQGRVDVFVSFLPSELDLRSGILKLVIKDTGIGISKDRQRGIYEKFTRGTPSNQGVFKGQGLGLRIVKQFVSELEGDIYLSSEINRGSEFDIYLPIKTSLKKEASND